MGEGQGPFLLPDSGDHKGGVGLAAAGPPSDRERRMDQDDLAQGWSSPFSPEPLTG